MIFITALFYAVWGKMRITLGCMYLSNFFPLVMFRFENMKLKCLYIGVAYSTAFELFGFELNELRDIYNRRRVEPVLEPYIPPVTGMILWLRVFITSIVPIMDLFQVSTPCMKWVTFTWLFSRSKKVVDIGERCLVILKAFCHSLKDI